ncbi:unnamed protein product (macronuclear) [Paramecium tetraurelia]|uniref:Uncharacterized protein n=1 Tax=Paramecium tetraurelia TaxID=5888 RepID=A0D0T6_PARTE|nr:uncharacterized protein GSPATT00012205001 [Paramecium tetraurelia]CAK76653.1 unnamed protein product [Paramecium tetraurelia]|eukprot:XP_001444050.1 hypothetical protein (macronuclear) [Paramecium tetraurelia strain d4-2]
MLQVKKEYNAPLKDHSEILNYLQKKLGQQVNFKKNEVVEKVFRREGNTLNNNQITLRIQNNTNLSCEHLLLEKYMDTNIDLINYEENIPEDCSSLLERVGFKLIRIEEYSEQVYNIKFMNCSICVQEQAKTKRLVLQLRDKQDKEAHIKMLQLQNSLEILLGQGGII